MSTTYNTLMEVNEAHELRLMSPGFDELCERFGEFLDQNELTETIGLCLLHRHNSIQADELMLQRLNSDDDGEPEFVTNAIPVNDAEAQNARPSQWCTYKDSSGDFVVTPLEFSTDPAVARVSTRFDREPSLLQEAARVLHESGLGNIIGITVTARDAISFDEDTQMFRETFREDVTWTNVLRVVARGDASERSTVPTNWSFRKEAGHVSAACFSECTLEGPGHSTKHVSRPCESHYV